MTTLYRHQPFGGLLKAWRTRRGATQQQLADLSTISVRAIRDLEFGRVARPRQDTVRLIADALRLTGRARAEFEAAGRADDESLADWPAAVPPAPLDTLLGRDSEVEVLRDALADGGQRLVALVGLGGVGKTRVALEVAGELHAAREVPVLWASPARYSGRRPDDPARVTESALTDPGTERDRAELGALIRDRAALIVLDGYPAAQLNADAISTLLHECRQLRILVTARSAPDIAGAWTLPLAPLAADPSIRLLVRHVRRSRPQFAVTPANADTVAALADALDGIPAALAAAASWFLFYEPEALLEQVRADPFAVLRHASLADSAPDLHDQLSRLTDSLDPTARTLLGILSGAARTVTDAAARTRFPVAVCARAVHRLAELGLVRGGDGARFETLALVGHLLGSADRPMWPTVPARRREPLTV
jgi:transcriptional regulator with XRE-family HTH domain